jgi:hypothetical protein
MPDIKKPLKTEDHQKPPTDVRKRPLPTDQKEERRAIQKEKQEVAENQNELDPDNSPVRWWFLATLVGTSIVIMIGMWTVGIALATAFDDVEDAIQAQEARITVLESDTLTSRELIKWETRMTKVETTLKAHAKDIVDLEKDTHLKDTH